MSVSRGADGSGEVSPAERLEVHNASVDEKLAGEGSCARIHLPTGRVCPLAHVSRRFMRFRHPRAGLTPGRTPLEDPPRGPEQVSAPARGNGHRCGVFAVVTDGRRLDRGVAAYGDAVIAWSPVAVSFAARCPSRR